MANKDLTNAFMSAMEGNFIQKATNQATQNKPQEKATLDIVTNKNTGAKQLVPVYLSEEERDRLKQFAYERGFRRKVRGKDAIEGNLSALLQAFAREL